MGFCRYAPTASTVDTPAIAAAFAIFGGAVVRRQPLSFPMCNSRRRRFVLVNYKFRSLRKSVQSSQRQQQQWRERAMVQRFLFEKTRSKREFLIAEACADTGRAESD